MESHAIPWPRYSAAAVLAALVTAALLLLMRDLIRPAGSVPDLAPSVRITDIVRLPEPDELILPPDREKPEVLPPPETEIIVDVFPIGAGDSISIEPPEISDPEGPISAGRPDGEMLPIVKVAPVYPRRAITGGIEGYVLLEFAVDETGRVHTPRVIESKPRGIFDQAALRAVSKFKYKPRIYNGAPQRVEGVLHRLTFELDDG